MTNRTRTHKKNFWFNDKEENELKRKSKEVGMTESDYIRNLVLGNELKQKPDEEFYKSIKVIRSISHNINQLATKAHSLGFIDEREYKKEVIKLDNLIDELKTKYLNVNLSNKNT